MAEAARRRRLTRERRVRPTDDEDHHRRLARAVADTGGSRRRRSAPATRGFERGARGVSPHGHDLRSSERRFPREEVGVIANRSLPSAPVLPEPPYDDTSA